MARSATAGATNHGFADTRNQAARAGAGPRLPLRLWVRLRKHGLDAALARGEERLGDASLALRREQLASPGERQVVADGLEHALEAEYRSRGLTAAVPVDLAAVMLARPALLQLIAALREDRPVEPRGVALSMRLLTDPLSPLYMSDDREALYREARSALLLLRAR